GERAGFAEVEHPLDRDLGNPAVDHRFGDFLTQARLASEAVPARCVERLLESRLALSAAHRLAHRRTLERKQVFGDVPTLAALTHHVLLRRNRFVEKGGGEMLIA